MYPSEPPHAFLSYACRNLGSRIEKQDHTYHGRSKRLREQTPQSRDLGPVCLLYINPLLARLLPFFPILANIPFLYFQNMLRDVLCLVLSFLAFSKNEAATGPCLSFWPLQIHLHIAMSVFPASQNPLHICICLSFLASQKLFQFNPMFVFLASSKNPLARTYVLCSRVLALPTVYEPRCLQSSLFPLSQQISPYIYFQNGEQHSACIGLFWPLKIHYILTYVCLSGLFEKLMMHMTCFLSSVSVSKNSWEASNVLCSWVLALPTVYEPSRLQSSFLLLAYKYCRVFYFQKHFTGWHGSLYFLRLSKSIGLAECLSFCFLKIRPRMVHVLCRLISKFSHEL